MVFRCGVACLVLCLAVGTSSGQRRAVSRRPVQRLPPNQVGPPQMVFVPIEVDAQIADLRNGLIGVIDGDARWNLRLGERDRDSRDRHRRARHAQAGRPMCASWRPIDKKAGRGVDKVEKLTLITPGKDGNRMLGAFYPQPTAEPHDSQQGPRKIGSPVRPPTTPSGPRAKTRRPTRSRNCSTFAGKSSRFAAIN